MGFNDKRAGSANPQSRGSVFDPELAAATTLDAVGSVFEGGSHTREPAGPTGPQGEMGLSVNRLTTTADSDNRTTTLNFYVGVDGNDQLIQVPVVVLGVKMVLLSLVALLMLLLGILEHRHLQVSQEQGLQTICMS